MNGLDDVWASASSISKGLYVTITNWLRRPRVTQQYPKERRTPFARYRGLFILRRDPNRPRETTCTACLLCWKACPTDVFYIEGTGHGKERHPVVFLMDLSRCMYCHLCIEACPFDAIAETVEYELTAYSRDAYLYDFDALSRQDRPQGRIHAELLAEPAEISLLESQGEPTPDE
jgi:formate hydrogenlyase subunit 6/NADH:ubiquinone oxidoreductase subunit I